MMVEVKLEKIQDPNQKGCTISTGSKAWYSFPYLYIIHKTLVADIFLCQYSSGRKDVGYDVE